METTPKNVKNVKYISKLEQLRELTDEQIAVLQPVAEEYAFRTNEYYNSLINWADPNDPIKKLIIPQVEELVAWGTLDASGEKLYQPVEGLEHKYRSTALLLCNNVCAAYCRFCFRKRLFQDDNDEVVKDVTRGVQYIAQHPEINNVLLTGGDPLVMSTRRLEEIFTKLAQVDHVKIIRIGTKVPAFNPYRILNDPTLPELLEKYRGEKQIYVMLHFNLVRELTDVVVEALTVLRKAGVTLVNQTPIIRGVNDSVEELKALFARLSFLGIPPYYVFGCRPTAGNKSFAVPVEEAYQIFNKARENNSGLANTARFIMSHKLGKVEVVGLSDSFTFLKYHNMVDSSLNGKIIVCRRNPEAYWFDDFTPIGASQVEKVMGALY